MTLIDSNLPAEYKFAILTDRWNRSNHVSDKNFYNTFRDLLLVVKPDPTDSTYVEFTGHVLTEAMIREDIDRNDVVSRGPVMRSDSYKGTWGPFFQYVDDPRDITKYRLKGMVQRTVFDNE